MSPFPERLQYESLNTQEEHALKALSAMLSYVSAHSPFYKELFAKHSIRQDDLKSLIGLKHFPFTTKGDMQERNRDFLCVPNARIREYTATSGTMGKPVTIALTESDLQRLAYNEAQAFRCADGSPEDIYQLALTLDRQFMAGMAYYSGIRAIGAASVRTGPGLPGLQWETAQRLGATAIVGVPSALIGMAEWGAAHSVDVASSKIRKAVCIGEPVRRADFSLNALGAKLSSIWPLQLYSTYAATELQTAFTECNAGKGGHHQPELIIVEIVNENGESIPDGEAGEVVVTTLGVEGMPLLRYKTGDIAALHAAPCSCGRHSKRLGPIIGRRGQMIKYRGTTLYPAAILDVLAGIPYIDASLIEAYSNELGTDELRIHLHATIEKQECEQALKPLLQSRLRVAPMLQFHTAESLQALQMPAGTRKAIRFLDNRTI